MQQLRAQKQRKKAAYLQKDSGTQGSPSKQLCFHCQPLNEVWQGILALSLPSLRYTACTWAPLGLVLPSHQVLNHCFRPWLSISATASKDWTLLHIWGVLLYPVLAVHEISQSTVNKAIEYKSGQWTITAKISVNAVVIETRWVTRIQYYSVNWADWFVKKNCTILLLIFT